MWLVWSKDGQKSWAAGDYIGEKVACLFTETHGKTGQGKIMQSLLGHQDFIVHAIGSLQGDLKKNDMNQFIVFISRFLRLGGKRVRRGSVGAERLDKNLMQ